MLTYCWGVSRAWSQYGRGTTQEGVGKCWPARRRTPRDRCWPRRLGRCRKPRGWWCRLRPQASGESATKPRRWINDGAIITNVDSYVFFFCCILLKYNFQTHTCMQIVEWKFFHIYTKPKFEIWKWNKQQMEKKVQLRSKHQVELA